ncbi:BZ3500_MvSof-1268-A1-R1_Chr4-3g07341 [Microbotryum saponariae]|uniref:BZ3500_MvSof-1268-A1-R1_Chr4-3g07341 protein n=1 Tax=Microbotryum saponariae TaxID=289078 RepID=A0A2X0L048_9BASI|nr:BZ3500_MvSof-1268-A1-R1_Chr4-3g07341 [Microbotryum saponariae]SDA07004.1 BZ3501_MvSof-1269-A2-R1_Chr4-2g07050 [Microbotryum saponariae]
MRTSSSHGSVTTTLLTALVLLLCACHVLAGADFYKILGLSKTASEKEIKKAYRRLSKQYHPDKNPEESAKAKFLEIGHAYEALSDPEKRKIYDRFGEEGLKQQQGGGGAFHDPFDVFRQAFGGQQQQRKGNNMIADIEVDLESIYSGDRINFNIARKQMCEECEGSGARSAQDVVECKACEGRGIRLVRHQLAPGIYQQVQMHCDQCAGRGKKTLHACPVCRGHRIVDSSVELTLDIDRGMPEGSEVVFEGEADESPDIAAGDVIVRVRSKRKAGGFVRKDSNLYWKEPLSLAEALLGFKKTVVGLDGHKIVLQRNGVTQPGFVQVVAGEGLPIYHESNHGDLYVEYVVVFPTELSPKLRQALETALVYKSPAHSEL